VLQAKEFLQEECKNVELSLKEALRYEYGRSRSKDFYDECTYRLQNLKRQIDASKASDLPELEEYSTLLSSLSALITRIERSHLGEFSWPFADSLELLARAVCQGVNGKDEKYGAPIFAISAEGGLEAYELHIEQGAVNFNFKRRIFNIVFPRTLKHHVLLHPILGHELGHAATTVPSMDDALSRMVLTRLEEGPLESEAKLTSWIDNTPTDSTKYTADMIEEMLYSWTEELFCDLFGLMLFGPSFVAAHYSLLSAIDPRGFDLGDEHPPNMTRFDMLLKAVEILGWQKVPKTGNAQLRVGVERFWKSLNHAPGAIPSWATICTTEQIQGALEGLKSILQPLGVAMYTPPAKDVLEHLVESLHNRIPPIGNSVKDDGVPELTDLDFRSILYAGWVEWHGQAQSVAESARMSFSDINRLCDRAILQQLAIDLWKKTGRTGTLGAD